MEVGEKDLAAPKSGALDGQGLLDLHDQFGAGEDRFGVRCDPGAGSDVEFVFESCPETGAALDQDVVPVMHELGHRRGHETDAVFVVLDFLGNSDAHRPTLQNCRLASAGRAGSDLDQARIR